MPMTMEKAQVTLPSDREVKVTRSFKAAGKRVAKFGIWNLEFGMGPRIPNSEFQIPNFESHSYGWRSC